MKLGITNATALAQGERQTGSGFEHDSSEAGNSDGPSGPISKLSGVAVQAGKIAAIAALVVILKAAVRICKPGRKPVKSATG